MTADKPSSGQGTTEQATEHPIDLIRSNSLTDLAARIRAEHEAAAAALNQGLQHAIAAGKLLIEAKKEIPHGQWLPWLKANCAISERTGQAYMRVARSFGKLDETKTQRVADLSFRDALISLASTGLILKQLPPESYDRALQSVEDHENAESWRHAVRRVRMEDARARIARSTVTTVVER
jgi:N-acetylglutamate synthase/N-acetylornithine aminotransferase